MTEETPRVESDNLQRFYSNSFRVEVSNTDAYVIFSQIENQIRAENSREAVIVELAKVLFSLDGLRSLSAVLQETILRHEEKMKQNQNSMD